VRPAEPSDAPTIIDFQLRMARETEGLELDPDRVRRGVTAVFADPAKGRYWVAEGAPGSPGIVASLLVIPEWSDWRAATVLWIHSVYVEPAWRRRGLFRRMYARLREEVDARPELAGLRLYVAQGNEGAQRVYEAAGMTRDHYHLYEWLK
jgi:GNAT superfamily N-acetyltransferase